MAKTKTEIHVTTVFDGELDATDVFVSLIAQKYGQNTSKENLAKTQDLEYNKDEVPTSGICWKNTAKSRDGRLWQSIRTMATRG